MSTPRAEQETVIRRPVESPVSSARAERRTPPAQESQALVCSHCQRILATRSSSYARSRLTESQRRTFVRAECRRDQGRDCSEPEAVQRVIETGGLGSTQGRPQPRPATRTRPVDFDTFLSPPGAPQPLIHKGGRPRKHAIDRLAHAAAQRAYRARRQAGHVAAPEVVPRPTLAASQNRRTTNVTGGGIDG